MVLCLEHKFCIRTRSSGDRAMVSGAMWRGFESLRVCCYTNERSYGMLKQKFEKIMQFVRYYEKRILFGSAGALFLILIILLLVNYITDGKPNTNAIKADAYEEVNELVDKYYTAIADGDTDTLKNIVVPFSSTDESAAVHKSELIEEYSNIKCYTHKDGVTKDYYIVFAVYEINFPDVETPVPGLETLFICRDAEDKLYINNDEENLTESETKKLEEILSTVEVMALFDDVETTFSIALHSDEGVAQFFDALGGDISQYEDVAATETPEGTDPESTESAESTEELTVGELDPDKIIGDTDEELVSVINLDMFQSEDSSSTVIAMIPVGSVVKVKAHLSSGFSKIVYNDVEGYVESDYIYSYIDVNDKVKGTCEYYTSCSNVIEPLGNLTEGTEYTRSRYYGNGYSQIKINDTYVYVKTSELSQ